MAGRFDFVSPGAAAGSALRDFLVNREAQQRQEMLDGITQQREQRLTQQDADQHQVALATLANTQANTARLGEDSAAARDLRKVQQTEAEAKLFQDTHSRGDMGTDDEAAKFPGMFDNTTAATQGAQTGTDENGVPQYDVQSKTQHAYKGNTKEQEDAKWEKDATAMLNDPATAPEHKEALKWAITLGPENGKAVVAGILKPKPPNEHNIITTPEGKVINDLVEPPGSKVTVLPKPNVAPTFTVAGYDADGNPTISVKPKVAGSTYETSGGTAVGNRVSSAKTVVSVGDNVIKQLSDPTYAAQLGPVMGRYNSALDFLGNPPQEYAELAGELESISMANMGVHGMRSFQGAKDINDQMSKIHTPEALAAYIKGLHSFSRTYIAQNAHATDGKGAAAAAGAAPPNETPEQRAKRLYDKYSK